MSASKLALAKEFVPYSNATVVDRSQYIQRQTENTQFIATKPAKPNQTIAPPPQTDHLHNAWTPTRGTTANTLAAESTSLSSKWIKGVRRDFIPLSIRSMYYEAPKPDTPPTKVWPFGFDPVWSETVESPKIESVRVSFFIKG